MNSLWPAVPRIPCLNTRTTFQTCRKVDSLAARLAHCSARTYSTPVISGRKGTILLLRRDQEKGAWRGSPIFNGLGFSTRTYASKHIITKFEQLPQGYKDQDGLAYRETPLSKEEVAELFNNQVHAAMANKILRVLHGRRVAGTLEDPSMSLPSVETGAVKVALAWLRKNVPVDEVECAGLRAEQELAAMESEIVSDAERIGLYKSNSKSRSKVSKSANRHAPNSTLRKDVYGESGLDKIRKLNEKKWEEEQAAEKKRQKQAAEINHNTGTLETLGARSSVELRRPGENPWLKYYLERAKILPDKPLEMSVMQRISPSLLLTVGVILASLVFVAVYKPPKRADRLWPDMPPSAATITSIILINTVVLVAWRFPPALRLLNKNFMFYPGYPRAMALIGCMFSHQTLIHFASNMAVLWFVGVRLHDEIGRANFLAVYMSSGALGGLASLMFWTLKSSFVSSHLGASGAVCGIIACYLMLNGSEKITLFGVFPPENWPSISAMAFLAVLVGFDVIGLRNHNKKITIDHWNHLGGYACGAAAGQVLAMRIRRRKEAEMERRKNMGFIDRVKEGRF
jgi:rhomboid-like protein